MSAKYPASSRYSVDDNNQSATRGSITKAAFFVHRVRAGDTIESLAAQSLGDHTRWWEIADLNPQFKFPTDLVVGAYIRIPK